MPDPNIPPPPDGSAVVATADAGTPPPPPDGSAVVPVGQPSEAPATTGMTDGTANIGPRKGGVEQWLGDLESDIRYGGGATLPGRALRAMGAQGIDVGAQGGKASTLMSPLTGAVHAAQGVAEIPRNPVHGALKTAGGVIEAAELPASFVAPEAAGAPGALERGAAAFDKVSQTAGKVAIDISAPGNQALKMQQLAESGGTLPKVVKDFLKRVTNPDKGALTYDEARDFYSNATRLSADEYNKLNPRLKKEIGQFTRDLGDSVADAAARAGKGEDYAYAMRQYRRGARIAKTQANITKAVKSGVGKAVGGAATGAGLGLGYETAKKALE